MTERPEIKHLGMPVKLGLLGLVLLVAIGLAIDHQAGHEAPLPEWRSDGLANEDHHPPPSVVALEPEAVPPLPDETRRDASTALAAPVSHVLLLSIDGLRSDAITALGPSGAPAFHRLMREGAYTLDARTDPIRSYTLPGHIGMITGRYADGSEGHHVILNRSFDGSVHDVRGEYVASIFDVAHDRGLRTAFLGGKLKFEVIGRSWDADHGAVDSTLPNNGRGKIDVFWLSDLDDEATLSRALELLDVNAPNLMMVHFALPDRVGHNRGWDVAQGSPYLAAVNQCDAWVRELMGGLEGLERPALLVTTDHGGYRHSHYNANRPENAVIPFLVWTPDALAGGDLYELNAGLRAVDPASGLPPVRNGEVGNLALHLLGLPPVEGSHLGLVPLRIHPN